MKTPTQTLAAALRILANDIESPDGVANAAISEAAERLDELMSQNYECKFFIENVMASIGAGATLSEVTDMLCDWWDSSFDANKTPTQYLREIQAVHFEKGFIQGVKFIGTGFVSESDYEEAKAYGDNIRKGGGV
jgi:hypothetical protein